MEVHPEYKIKPDAIKSLLRLAAGNNFLSILTNQPLAVNQQGLSGIAGGLPPRRPGQCRK